jgi:vacuolar protein-sorting-associated protein 4
MIKNSLKKTRTTLTGDQYEDLAVKTEGYSGSDISVLVRDAVYEPVRKLQSAKKFRQVIVEGKAKWTPVPDNEEGTPMTFMTLS